ncbi:phenylhydantoinase, partial [mine drainage metagenome]
AEAPSGIPGTETMLPLLLAQVRDGAVSLATLLAAACDRPARWLGRPHGRLAPGHRAHLLVVDFTRRVPIAAERLHAPAGWSAFEGHPAIFPREVYFDGVRVVQDGEYVGRPTGRVVRPDFARGGTPAP